MLRAVYSLMIPDFTGYAYKSVEMQQVYTEYREFLYRFFLKHIKIPSLAEDLAQDVFVKFWQRKDFVDSVRDIDAWLYTLARNHLMDHYRKLATERRYQEMVWQEMERHTNAVIEDIYKKELEQKIAALLETLPPRQKEVYELSREKGFSLEQIAEALDISPNTAKNHLVESLKFIRAGLKSVP